MPGAETGPDLIELFVAPLQEAGFRYFVTGSIAATIYGEPRATHDIDLVVTLGEAQIPSLAGAFPEDDFYVPPAEVLRVESVREERGHFNVIHHESGLKADFFLAGRTDALHAWAFEHTRSYSIDTIEVQLAPPEYVIARKLEFFREGHSEKHLRDVRSMLRISDALIDRSVLARWVREAGVEAEWQEVEGSEPGPTAGRGPTS